MVVHACDPQTLGKPGVCSKTLSNSNQEGEPMKEENLGVDWQGQSQGVIEDDF